MEYISKRGNHYRVRKIINGREYHRTYDTLEEAITARDYLINFLKNEGIGRKPITHLNYTGIKYIKQVPSGKFVLQRKGVHYGTYSTIIDAVKDKLFWESIDWDMDLLYYY